MLIEEPLCVAGIFSAKDKSDAVSIELLEVNLNTEIIFGFSFSLTLLIGKLHILHRLLIGHGPSFIVDDRRNTFVVQILLQLLHKQNWVIIAVKHVHFLARTFELIKTLNYLLKFFRNVLRSARFSTHVDFRFGSNHFLANFLLLGVATAETF